MLDERQSTCLSSSPRSTLVSLLDGAWPKTTISPPRSLLTTTVSSSFEHDTTEIGVTLTGLGALFLFLGVVFFFDRGLLAMGNVLFLAGVIVILGVQSALKFFLKQKNYKGSLFFVVGVVLVVWGWTLVGFGVELYGMWGLFAGVFPAMLTFLRTVPGLKTLLDMPAVKNVLNRVAPAGSGLPV